MHLIRIKIEGLRAGAPVVLDLGAPDALSKWTVLGAGRERTGVLAAIAASLAPGRVAHLLGPHLRARFPRNRGGLRTDVLFRREHLDQGAPGVRAAGWQLEGGLWECLGEARQGPPGSRSPVWRAGAARRASPLGNLVLGYGRVTIREADQEALRFDDTDYPYLRLASLFDPRITLAHPVAFLDRVNWKANRLGVHRQRLVLARLCHAFDRMLGPYQDPGNGPRRPPELSPRHWDTRGFPYEQAWQHLRAWERRTVSLSVDAARQASDAFPRCENPLDQPGVLLLDRPDLYCPPERLEGFFTAMDRMFPRLQFLLTLGTPARARFPSRLATIRLGVPPKPLPKPPPYKRVLIRPRTGRLRPGGVLLVQVDGTLPNLALMQLGRHLKGQGHRVALRYGSLEQEEPASTVYASAIYTAEISLRRVESLRRRYGERLVLGGSGVDLTRRLDPEVEGLPPDYSLYPSLGDRAMGFLTRGCPGRCAFCVVPRKEGRVRQVADLDMLLQGRRRKLILLDDNLLAHPRAAELLENMVRRGLSVNFNQALDLRRLKMEHAELLRRLDCSNLPFLRRVYHFGLNDTQHLDTVRRNYERLRVTRQDNVEFLCMYGFNTSLAGDLERLRFLRSLPRAYVFMQRYRPVPGGPPPDLTRLFDEHADRHLDELVRVVFPQNMKNVERYYHWLAIEYARQRGRIHLGLVDTLFRYNHRHKRGAFLQALREIAGTEPRTGVRNFRDRTPGVDLAYPAGRRVAVGFSFRLRV